MLKKVGAKMTDYHHKRIIKISIVISLVVAMVVFLLAMKVLNLAYTQNPEYAQWNSLSIEEKSLKKADGQAVHPEPEKQRALTQNEILILSGGLALFSPLTVFPFSYILFRRRQKDRIP